MARNEEKANSMLSRWLALKQEETALPNRRPFSSQECNDVRECERWRMQVIREVTRKIQQIQNPGLGEFRVRDLNDQINKLLREKFHWEERIIELGGPNYHKISASTLDSAGRAVPGQRGYLYFGEARKLPGVRELLEAEPPASTRRKKGDLSTYVNADYYGYRDEDDGIIVPLEDAAEADAIAKAEADWKQRKEAGEFDKMLDAAETRYAVEEEQDVDMKPAQEAVESNNTEEESAVPTQEDIEKMLLERRKQMLIDKYASQELMADEQESKQLLGRS